MPKTIRVEFYEVDGIGAVEIVSAIASHLYKVQCDEDDLPKEIKEKIALLKTAGISKQKIAPIGRQVSNKVFYVNVDERDWEKMYEDISGARQRRLAQNLQLERRSH